MTKARRSNEHIVQLQFTVVPVSVGFFRKVSHENPGSGLIPDVRSTRLRLSEIDCHSTRSAWPHARSLMGDKKASACAFQRDTRKTHIAAALPYRDWCSSHFTVLKSLRLGQSRRSRSWLGVTCATMGQAASSVQAGSCWRSSYESISCGDVLAATEVRVQVAHTLLYLPRQKVIYGTPWSISLYAKCSVEARIVE